MVYTLLITGDAEEDFMALPRSSQPACLTWIQEMLRANPRQAGLELLSEQFKGLRAISHENKIQITFGVNEAKREVLIFIVTPSQAELAKKQAELVAALEGRVLTTQHLLESRVTGTRSFTDFLGE